MSQFEPVVRDGTLYLESGADRLEIGDLDAVVEAVGGETYTIQYDERDRRRPWLDTDDEGRLDIDVRDAVTSMSHTEELVAELRTHDTTTDRYGIPARTVAFADAFVDIVER